MKRNLILMTALIGLMLLTNCSKDDPAPVTANEVTLNKTMLTLAVGESETLTATVKPDNAADKTVTWTSSTTSVATVTNGLVTAVAAGSTTITATTAGGKSATCAVTVNPVAASEVTLNKTTLTLFTGDSETLTATVKPDNTADKTLTWTSSAPAIASVVDGAVTALAAGAATITATTANGKTAECALTVKPNVYVAGYEYSGKWMSSVAKVWKDGVATALTNSTHSASARSVYVSGGDVYVAGEVRNLCQ